MIKSFRFLLLSLILVSSLIFSPVTSVKALTFPAEINKSFTPISIISGGTSRLRINIYNPNTNPLTNAAWVDNLIGVQPGLSIANPPAMTQTCAGTVVANAGATQISLSGGTVPAQVGSTPGTCYVEVSVTSTTPGNLINTIPANQLSASTLDGGVTVPITNTTPASATLNVIGVQPPTVSKGFAPNTIFVGQTSTLTITIQNNDLNNSLTGTTFTDSLPAGVVLANPVNQTLTGCGAGTLTGVGALPLAPGGTSLTLNNGTILKNSNCVITVAVTSVSQNAYTNTIPAGPPGSGSIQTQQGVTNASPASANLNVQAFNVSKAFSVSPIAAGDTSVLTITIQNPANFTYTGVQLTDTLPAGDDLEFVNGTQATTCTTGADGATVTTSTVLPSTVVNRVTLQSGTIQPNSTCTITVTVRARMDAPAATYTNTIPVGALITDQGNSNHAPASANLAVQSLSIAKAFAPATFAAGSTSTLTITLRNPSPNPFTVTTLNDVLPAAPNTNLTVVSALTTCAGGVVTTTPPRTVTLTGGTIPGGSIAAPGTCTITVVVMAPANAPAAGPYVNTIPAGALGTVQGGTNAAPATANVSVTTVSVNKAFAPNNIVSGVNSTLTITITNPATGSALTGVNLTDTLPAGLQIAAAPATPQCGGGVVTNTLTSVTLTGGSLPAGPSTCTLVVLVTAPASTSAGTYTNNIPPGALTTAQGPVNSNTVNVNLTVQAVSVVKAFSPTSFQSGGSSTLTITLRNPTSSAYTGVNLTDTLPAQLSIAAAPLSINNCGGALTAVAGTQLIQLTGGTIPASATPPTNNTCTLIIPVTSTTPGGPYTNTIPAGALTTAQGPSNVGNTTANVSVYTVGAGISATKAFTPAAINSGQNSQLQITINAPADTDLTNYSITDNLPGDLTVSNSTLPTATGCGAGAVFNPAIGDTVISLTGGTVTRGTPCVITVYVTSNTGSTAGVVHTNTINPGDITNTESRSIPLPVTANLTVRTISTLTTSKAFYPPIVNPGGLSTLTITLTNTNASDLVSVVLSDTLPGTLTNGVIVAPTPNANTTCKSGIYTGDITAVAGTQTISMANGFIPAQVGGVPGICTISVDVRGMYTAGALPVTRTNTIPAANVTGTISGTNSTMNAQANATAQLTIQNLSMEIVKGFNPQLVYGGAVSTLSIELRNPNTSAVLTGITFTDNMPAGMIIADVPNFTPSAIGDCGPAATLTGTPGTAAFTFSNGTLAANTSCTMTLSVTMIVNGNLTNTIPANAVATFNGVTNQTPTSASLTNLAGASISKGFAPNPIAAGLQSYSLMTITIRNTSNVVLTGLGLVDNLPAGLEVAGGSAPAAVNNCGGTLTANPGDVAIQLSGAGLPAAGGFTVVKCTLIIPITGANPGTFTNVIPAGTLVTNEGTSNVEPATAALTLTPFSLGNRVWYDTDNNGLLNGAEVGISGVRVNLYRDNGTTPGVFDAGDTFVGFETTDANGYYRFDNIGADDYIVAIPSDNFRDVGPGDTVPANPLSGYVSSGTSIASDGTVTDGFGPDADITVVDSDDNGATSFTSNVLDYVSAQAVTIGPGSTEPTNEADAAPNPALGEAPDNQSDRTVDFGFYRQQLSNQVFSDLNNDGIFNAGDTPLAGAIVQLYASNGTTEINVGPDGILGSADDAPGGVTTAAAGTYLFSGLPEGDYIVKVTPPSGSSTIDSADTTTPNNNIDNNDNGVGTSSGQVSSNIVTLIPGVTGVSTIVTNNTGTTHNPSIDFGFVPLYSLGNRVWFDTDNNSAINGSEVGVTNVRVELYLDNGGTPGVFDATDTFVSFENTDANGYYRFDGLNPGNYVVVIPSSEFGTGGPLDGYWSSGTSIANNGAISDSTANDPDNDLDSDDNGETNFVSNNINYVSAQAVTLGPGLSEPTNDNDPTPNPGIGEASNDQSNRTVDFGFYRVELGNQAFWDINKDGMFDAGDVVLAGATVRLYAADGVTEINVGPDGRLGTADDAAGGVTTDVSGTYLFSNLPAGDYIVKVTPPTGFASTTDVNADTITPNNNIDNNDNGVGIGVGEVSSNVVTLTPGFVNVSNVVTNSTGTTQNPSLDFGFVPNANLEFSIGNRVWFDTDNNGAINGSEVGIGNVRVNLYLDNGGTPGVYDAGDSFIDFRTTDASGYYRFDNLPAGNYVVVIPSSEFGAGTPLDGYWSSGTSIAANGTITDSIGPDADANPTDSDDNGVTTLTSNTVDYVSSRAVTLGPSTNEPVGETDALPNPALGEEPDNQSNRTVDFGFYRIQLGNQVFVDVNNDGIYNSGDLTLAGATVQLFASNGTTEINVGADGVLGTADDGPGGVLTGVDGMYLFDGLPAGDYVVRVKPPIGYASTVDVNTDTGSPNNNVDNNDNGVGVSSGQVDSNIVSLIPGATGVSTTVTNSTGTTQNPSLDFGFVPSNGFRKTILGTSETFTNGINVAIGEMITYQITIDLKAGVPLNNAVVTDHLDKGLAFVDCLLVEIAGTNVTSTVCPPTVSSITDPGDPVGNPANPGRQVVFNFGNIAAPAADSSLVIQYRAVVLNVIENQENVRLNNNAALTWTGGSLSGTAPDVSILEPDLAIDKSATPTAVAVGTSIQFTLSVTHTAASATDAFDVLVTDILPAGLEFIPCTPITYTGEVPTLQPDTCNLPNGNTLTFGWDVFPLNKSATIVFFARFDGTKPSLINNAVLSWTSLPVDLGPGNNPVEISIYNGTSTERWYDPTNPADNYQVIDGVGINQPGGGDDEENLPAGLPATGFAPNVITALPEQPADKSYTATDVWLEIPSLNVNIPVVGVPLVEGDWDVSWLWQQAGWLNGTAFPGWQGNSVLTGHVTLPNGKSGPFAELGQLKWGDKILVHAYGSVYTFVVRQNRTVSPNNTSVLKHEDDAWLTLITCKAYDEETNTYARRIAVRASFVSVEVEKQTNPSKGR